MFENDLASRTERGLPKLEKNAAKEQIPSLFKQEILQVISVGKEKNDQKST